PPSEKPPSATGRRIPCRWSKRQSAPACARLASRMARSAGSSASSGATAAAAISRSGARSTSPTESGRAAGAVGPCGVTGRPGERRGLRGKIAIARLCNACAAWTRVVPSPRRPRDGQKRTPGGIAVSGGEAGPDGGADGGAPFDFEWPDRHGPCFHALLLLLAGAHGPRFAQLGARG